MPLDVVESPCQLALVEPKLDLLVLRRRQQLLESLLVPVDRDPRLGRNLAAVRGSVEMTVRLLRLDAAVDGPHLRSLAERLIERAALPHWRYRPAANPTNVAASLSFLVPRDEVPEFLARIAPVASRAAGLAVVPTGPAPAYSFVSSTAMSHVPALAPTG